MARSHWLDLSLLPLLFLLRLLPPQRAVPWAWHSDRHGKSSLLRRGKEWGHSERLPLSHRLWAQPPDLRRAQRLISPLLLHDPVLGLRRGWRDTRQDAHRGTPRTSRLLRTRRHVSQSVVVVCNVRWIRATWWKEKCRLISIFWCHTFFLKTSKQREMVDRSVKPEERNSSNAQIRTLLEKQRQMIIAENREEVGHHELQAAHAEEERRILREELWRQQLEFREAHQQNLTEMEELRKFQSSTLDTISRRKLIKDQNTILELSGIPGRWISSQWKFPRYQSTSVFPTSSDTGRDVETSFRVAEPQRRAAKHLGHTWYIGKRFCKSTFIFISTLSLRNESMEYGNWGAASYVFSGEKWKTRTKSRSEMPVWTVSQRFSHFQWRKLFKELWSRQTTTADFGSSLWQVP